MTLLRLLTAAIGLLLAAGEVARWWGQARFLPLAFDELLVAAGLLWAAWAGRRIGLTTAWGAFCGFTLSLLVPTLDHLLYGPAKESAGFYAAVLSVMLAVGLAALLAALRLTREPSPAP
ncbi:MAG: hypothetical protein AB7O49_08935 [Sphingomonadales bacterium]